MGIDFRLENDSSERETPRWSYSGFSRFRELLAESLGWPEWSEWSRAALKATLMNKPCPKMPKPPSDSWLYLAIMPLLTHSDCDGKLESSEMTVLNGECGMDTAIEGALNIKPLSESAYDVQEARKLITLIKICRETGDSIKFC